MHILGYALIIAVNNHGLKAPEPDAIKLRDVLTSIGIPATSIKMLTGRTATRQNIIRNLENIADNRQIVEGAPILIYYAGHATCQIEIIPGADQRHQFYQLDRCQVEYIVPVDTSSQVPPIPDITISSLLGRIARKKSNHITLMFDCCFAAGGSRDEAIGGYDFTTKEHRDKLAELDQGLWSEALENPPPYEGKNSRAEARAVHPQSFCYPGTRSHVMIASCHETQMSQEYTLHGASSPQGLFTTALIEALGECTEDKVFWAVTNVALFERIKTIMNEIKDGNRRALPHPQDPQCEGYNKHRPVFSTSALPHGSRAIAPLVVNSDHGTCLLPIGRLAGVGPQTTFEICDYPSGRLSSLGRYRIAAATDISETQTILTTSRRLQLLPEAYAVMCTPPITLPVEMVEDFPMLYNDSSFQSNLMDHLGNYESPDRFIMPVQHGHKLHASYSTTTGSVELRNNFGGVLRIRNGRQEAPGALAKAAMFFHHLDQPNSPSMQAAVFELWTHELAPIDAGPDRTKVLGPDEGSRSILLRPNVEFRIDASSSSFGLQIINRQAYPLFVYVFYFNPNDYSITAIYLPPSSDIQPLFPGGDVKIGYGASGASALGFSINDDLDKDTGFVKVYYSTVYSEMGVIQQEGFEAGSGSRSGHAARSSPSLPYGSIIYPITVINPRRRR